MSSGDGQVVDAPHRPSRQPFRYSLGDRRDYLSKAEHAFPRNSTALFLTSLFSDCRLVVSRPVNGTNRYLFPLRHTANSPMGTTTPIRHQRIRKELQLRVSHDALR